MSPETIEQLNNIGRIKTMKVGEPITQMHIDSIRFFLGSLLDMLTPFSTTIEFKDGVPTHTTGNDLGISVSEDGGPHRELPHVDKPVESVDKPSPITWRPNDFKEKTEIANQLYSTICPVLAKYEGYMRNSHHATQTIVKNAVDECESWIVSNQRAVE